MKFRLIILIALALFIPTIGIFAQVLEEIPGQTSVPGTDLVGYLNNLYRFGISITGILAVFMIGVGAFAYIVTSAGNSSKIMDAKEKIINALIGLVIALTAYLLLFVINPDLVGGTLTQPSTAINEIAIPTTSSSAVGCCLSSYSAICNKSTTKINCDGLGGYFQEGSFTCENSVGNNATKTCQPSSAPVSTSAASTGCCIYRTGVMFDKICTTSMDELTCESQVDPSWISDSTPTCSAATGSATSTLTCN